MKKNNFFLLFSLFITTLCAQNPKKNLFKINVVPIFSKVYEFQYERVISKKSTIQIGLSTGKKIITDNGEFKELHLEYFGNSISTAKEGKYSEKTFTLNIDYRYFLGKEIVPKGLYISPSLQYVDYEESFSALREEYQEGESGWGYSYNAYERKRKHKLYSFRVLVGYQLFITNTIVFNPYFGPSYAFGDAKDFFDEEDKDAKGIGVNFGVYVGIAL